MRRRSYDEVTAEMQPHLRSLAQRRRSAPSVVFGKALGMSWPSIREECVPAIVIDQCPFVLGLSSEDSELILDDTVQLTEGQKTSERHVFLFSDVLVIAKLKSRGSYRLKHRVNLEQLWVCDLKSEDDEGCEDEDGHVHPKKTVVLAWSVSLCLLTFSSPEVKERWLDTVHRKITEARKRTATISPPPSVLMKVLSSTTTNKVLSGGGMEDSVIDLQVNALHGNGSSLQCKTELAIAEHDGGKRSLFSKLKRRDTHTGMPTRPGHKTSLLFGQPLPGDSKIPKPIADLLVLLWRKGPDTEGVFRTACNSKNLSAVRDQLNSGVAVDLEALPVTLLVGLLKTFLRELPGSLLVAEHYAEWIEALEKEKKEEIPAELRRIVSKLPEANRILLQYLLCLLRHIIQRSEKNKMDPKNLAICIAPTLLQLSSQPLDVSTVEKVTSLTQFLIENCCEIFGERILSLLGDPEEELGHNSDTMSSHQHDSAYDSTDGESGEATGQTQQACPHIQIQCSVNHSHSSEEIFEPFTKPFDRRSSEPAIFSSVGVKDLRFLARSHDDCSSAKEYGEQPLKKQNSDDSFLQAQRRPLQPLLRKTTGSLNLEVPVISKNFSCSSSCSLESTNSNISENSVFANSPLPSPSSPRKIQPERHMSLNVKSKMDTNSRRPFPFKRAKSLGSFSINKASVKKTEAQKEGTFSCGTLQEDSQNEAEVLDEPVRRQRPLSAIEVFEHVDRRDPGSPPSYQQAVNSGVLQPPPEYRTMTVHDARGLGQRSRPMSMNDYILDSSPVCQILDKLNFSNDDLVGPQQGSFRQRAMSESIGCTRIDKLHRRCSQPVFEELSYGKESYV
ncbi:T cell activation RhoGTPase activating protein b isoform X1 [Ictalurus punctatus]|uniref:T cell activation RhoGTPase activating protein b isoform X1 n=2 Tax=Ictalurus punctatus TaxID=7998 RepID=A0A2D0Q1B7_ICTPU|nr:T cell activation RhoGTPase activating protein b isoform X1 [Ictalurus punctatus]